MHNDRDASRLECVDRWTQTRHRWLAFHKERGRTGERLSESFFCLYTACIFLMSSVDAGLSPRIRQLIAQHRASLVSLRVQLELLPDIAAVFQEYASEHDVCEQ